MAKVLINSICRTSLCMASLCLACVFSATCVAEETAEQPAASATKAAEAASVENPPTEEQIDKWIAQLGDSDYFVRQEAQEELVKFGFEAFDALSTATTHEDLEIASRAKYLLKRMRVEWTAKGDTEEVRKLLADYESLPLPTKLTKMRALAELPGGAGLPALCRLVRYEKSPVISKQAAIQLITQRGEADPLSGADAEAIRKALAGSNRPAAKWLLAWLRFANEPAAAATDLRKLIDAELATADTAPSETSPEIAAALVRVQIGRLKKLGDTDQAMAAMRRLIDLEEGDPATIADLLDWMIQQKAWGAIDDLAGRFKPQFKDQPILMYGLAQAKAEQGDKERAETIAAEAIKLNPGKSPEQLIPHLTTAFALKSRGLFPWALREYRHVIDTAPASHIVAINSRFSLAEMFHDQGKDLEAAEEIQHLLDALKNRPASDVAGRSTDEIRSRMHYFLAKHFQREGDAAKKLEHIEKALAGESPDIDLLIMAMREADLKEEPHKLAEQAVEKSAAEMRELIENVPDNAINYNQAAWLLGNASRKPEDLNEAIKLSERSLELSPENGGYYDTLGHIYFNKGDLEKAVSLQEKAAELEPHSGLIQEELKLFRAALEEKKR